MSFNLSLVFIGADDVELDVELVEMVVFDELDELVVDELFVPLQALRSERRIKVDYNVLNFFIFVSFTSSIYK